MSDELADLLTAVRACRICVENPLGRPLPHEPRPVLQLSSSARIAIFGQAPGRRVHQSGVPWDDPSGVRLRRWLGLTDEQFYDASLVAILPMGFCFPGKATSGDLPPRPECAATWHGRLIEHLPSNRLNVIIGQYAQRQYLTDSAGVTETVRRWAEYLPNRIVLPHPSPRNTGWFSKNPWFEDQVVPAVQGRVAELLTDGTRC